MGPRLTLLLTVGALCLAPISFTAAFRAIYCIPSVEDASVINKCSDYFMEAASANVSFMCIEGKSALGCMEKIAAGTAHLTTLDGNGMYAAYQTYGILPLVAEDRGEGFTNYYAVAIVEESWCKAQENVTIESLKGVRSCHSGFRDAEGWVLPVGHLLSTGIMPIVSKNPAVADDAESVAAWFNKTCAPQMEYGAETDSTYDNDIWEALCTGCEDQPQEFCPTQQMYSGPEGALRCLMDGRGDVAFTRQDTALDYAKGGHLAQDWASKPISDFRIVCPSGGCQPVESYSTCNWGRAPARAFVTSPSLTVPSGPNAAVGRQIQEALSAAIQRPGWLQKMVQLGGYDYSVLDPATQNLRPVEAEKVSDYFGPLAIKSFEAFYDIMKPARLCVTTEEEYTKCLSIMEALSEYDHHHSGGPGFRWGCHWAFSVGQCFEALASGRAEMRLVDAAALYEAAQVYSLQPIVSETYGESGASQFYSVAVVNKDFCETSGNVTVHDLHGLDSCHAGYQDSAGWWMPLGSLAAKYALTNVDTRPNVSPDAQSMETFFGKMCAPGVTLLGPAFDEMSNPKEEPGLCQICKSNCTMEDAYAGYDGAFRCLMEGAGNVAFTKHVVPLEYAADGLEAEVWATKKKEEFRLVCSQGGCGELDDYETCNFGEVKGASIVVSPTYNHIEELRSLLVNASKDPVVSEKLFFTDDFFGDGVDGLEAVYEDVRNYLGDSAMSYAALYVYHWMEPKEAYHVVNINRVRFCVPARVTGEVGKECDDIMRAADFRDWQVSFSCVFGGSPQGCMSLIERGVADATVLEPADYMEAILTYQLAPLLVENHNGEEGRGYSVAVVHADFCTGLHSAARFASLKDRPACFSTYGAFGSWQMPLGLLYERNLTGRPVLQAGIARDAIAAETFFGQVCAPGITDFGPAFGPNGTSTPWAGVCGACGHNCSADPTLGDLNVFEEHNYAGPIKCLMDGSADVGFTTHTAALRYTEDGTEAKPWSTLKQNELRLLCPNGGCAEVGSYQSCNLGKIPPRGWVGRGDLVNSLAVIALHNKINADPEWFNRSKALTASNGEHVFFSPEADDIRLLSYYEKAWGTEAVTLGEAFYKMSRPVLTICVDNQETLDYCRQAAPAYNEAQVNAAFRCKLAALGMTCAEMVKNNEADLTVLDSFETFLANEEEGLVPVAMENLGTADDKSYSVAVVGSSFCRTGTTLDSLRNARSCHSGFRRTLGWVIPVGRMLVQKPYVMPYVTTDPNITNDAQSVADFFGGVCAPRTYDGGPKRTDSGEGQTWDRLCSSCSGDCTENDPYYGDSGAMRCLMDGYGSVAFTDHQTPLEVVKDSKVGAAPEWSTATAEELRLLCPSGGCARLEDYEQCNFASVPSSAIVMRLGDRNQQRVRQALASIPVGLQYAASPNSTTDSFLSGPEDFLFSTGVVSYLPVHSIQEYLGFSRQAFQGFLALDRASTSTAGRRR